MTSRGPRRPAMAALALLNGLALAALLDSRSVPPTEAAFWLEAAVPLSAGLAWLAARQGPDRRWAWWPLAMTLVAALIRLILAPHFPPTDYPFDALIHIAALGAGFLALGLALYRGSKKKKADEEDHEHLSRQALALIQFNCALIILYVVLSFTRLSLFDLEWYAISLIYAALLVLPAWLAWRLGQKRAVYLRAAAILQLLALISPVVLGLFFGLGFGLTVQLLLSLLLWPVVGLIGLLVRLRPSGRLASGNWSRPITVRIVLTAGLFALSASFVFGAGLILSRLDLDVKPYSGPTQTVQACRLSLELPTPLAYGQIGPSVEAFWPSRSGFSGESLTISDQPLETGRSSPAELDALADGIGRAASRPEQAAVPLSLEIINEDERFQHPARLIYDLPSSYDWPEPPPAISFFDPREPDGPPIQWTLLVELPDRRLTFSGRLPDWSGLAGPEQRAEHLARRTEEFVDRAARLLAAYRPAPPETADGPDYYQTALGTVINDGLPDPYQLKCEAGWKTTGDGGVQALKLSTDIPSYLNWVSNPVVYAQRGLNQTLKGLADGQHLQFGFQMQSVAGLKGQSRARTRQSLIWGKQRNRAMNIEWTTTYASKNAKTIPLRINYYSLYGRTPVSTQLGWWRTLIDSVKTEAALESPQ